MVERSIVVANPDRADIYNEWCTAFGRPPPKHLSTSFMQRALGWEAQSKQSGGLQTDIKRALQSIASGKKPKLAVPRKVATGAHLVREWNGRTYQVEVLERGFRMDGREYGSLTAIAKKITGANWSGPRFFGLKGA
ncbi:DUF2924 domain-containing protein [Falsihalocynthiibacter sp. BN13B15]|uniref:DUF2924 domain-containing protein n=1 Tax=Falsihalocynthiibacter sp. BN13B15 TaxID=3240871 RepID=UPI00350FFC14